MSFSILFSPIFCLFWGKQMPMDWVFIRNLSQGKEMKQKARPAPHHSCWLYMLSWHLVWVVLISPTFFPLSRADFSAPCKLAQSGYVALVGYTGSLAKSDGDGHPSSYNNVIYFIYFVTFGSQAWWGRFSYFVWSLDAVCSQASAWMFLLMTSAELTRRL